MTNVGHETNNKVGLIANALNLEMIRQQKYFKLVKIIRIPIFIG